MNCFIILISFILSAPVSGYGQKPRVMGGYEAAVHSHPYIVSLQTKLVIFANPNCAGSIITRYSVLTAAHCLDRWYIKWFPLDAVAGAHRLNYMGAGTQRERITQRIPHPLYSSERNENDIAVVKTKNPFVYSKTIQPIRLPTNVQLLLHPEYTQSLWLAGWGALSSSGWFPEIPNGLQELQVTYIPFKECVDTINKIQSGREFLTFSLVERRNICMGPISGGLGACNGDSGGPVILIPRFPIDNTLFSDGDEGLQLSANVVLDFNGQRRLVARQDVAEAPILVGVVSWGPVPCGEEGFPSVLVNVSYYIHFIANIIATDFIYTP